MTGTDFLINMMKTPDAKLSAVLGDAESISKLAGKYGQKPEWVTSDIHHWLRRDRSRRGK